jgi:hypothetical protein
MRRYVPSNFGSIRSKAKLFHRSIETMQDDGIGLIRPGYRLTDAQADLARTLGFDDWSELKRITSPGGHGDRIDDECFSGMARKLASIVGSNFVATSLLVRIGLAADIVSVASDLTSLAHPASLVEFARAIDLLTERMMEIDLSTREAQSILGIIEACSIPPNSTYGMIGYFESLLAWARFAIGGEKIELASRFVDHGSIERFGSALPQSGIFVISGTTGSGRSHAGLVLARHMRGGRRVVFSASAQCGLQDRRTERSGSIVFVDDAPRDDAAFRHLVEIAKHSLVILCVVASDHVDAHNRIWFKLHHDVGLSQEAVSELVAGGVHCGRGSESAVLTPWNPHTGHPHTTYFVNGDGRIFDDPELHLRDLSYVVALELPRDDAGAVDRSAAHDGIVEAVLKTTAVVPAWRGKELDRRVSERLDEMEAAYAWLHFQPTETVAGVSNAI